MALTPAEIQALLNKPQSRGGPRKGGGRSGSGKSIDTSIRDIQTWFKLQHKIFDESTGERATCDNPNCIDPRNNKGSVVVAEISGKKMCRHCFLDGYGLHKENQLELGS